MRGLVPVLVDTLELVSERIRSGHDAKAWVDGIPLEGRFTLEIHNGVDADELDDRVPPEGLDPSDVDVQISKTITFDDPRDRALFPNLGEIGTVEVEVARDPFAQPRPPRALWGGLERRGDVQVNSLEDRMASARSITLSIPRVRMAA